LLALIPVLYLKQKEITFVKEVDIHGSVHHDMIYKNDQQGATVG
jgi:hypothetical protein